MVNWVTVSSLLTAGGTLVLAFATFGATRSANRTARIAEESLLSSERPLLMPTRADDPAIKVGFMDDHWVQVPGGGATVEVSEDAAYLTISVRNAGSGIAVLQGWQLVWGGNDVLNRQPGLDELRWLSRDIYIPAGELYFWQGAIRDRSDPDRQRVIDQLAGQGRLVVDILYGDHRGGQRRLSRFTLTPTHDGRFVAAVARHWSMDGTDPR
jgi:hypothetical protein